MATTGGPRVIDVFDGNGAPSGPNYLLFSDAARLPESLWDRSGSGSRLRRMRPYLELPRELWIPNLGILWDRYSARDAYWQMYLTLEAAA